MRGCRRRRGRRAVGSCTCAVTINGLRCSGTAANAEYLLQPELLNGKPHYAQGSYFLYWSADGVNPSGRWHIDSDEDDSAYYAFLDSSADFLPAAACSAWAEYCAGDVISETSGGWAAAECVTAAPAAPSKTSGACVPGAALIGAVAAVALL